MSSAPQSVQRIVVLLRGVNVGGHRLAMADFRDTLERLGCTDVVTYIQSGNAVVTPPAGLVTDLGGDLEARLSTAISDVAGYHVPVVTRSAEQLAAVIAANPYQVEQGKQLHVTFFSEPPAPELLDGLEVDSFHPEACTVSGREIYLYVPDGMGVAKLPIQLERAARRTGAPGTTRNWNTVVKLLDLAR
ncbi:MAG: DUF1697 domain-containing protein [Galactobacter sp.]